MPNKLHFILLLPPRLYSCFWPVNSIITHHKINVLKINGLTHLIKLIELKVDLYLNTTRDMQSRITIPIKSSFNLFNTIIPHFRYVTWSDNCPLGPVLIKIGVVGIDFICKTLSIIYNKKKVKEKVWMSICSRLI
jgi:hypothetical protein